MPLYHVKGKLVLEFAAYADVRMTVDEDVEADNEDEAKAAVIDRIVDDGDHDLPDFFMADSEFNNSEFDGEVEEVEFAPESEAVNEAAIAYKQMQQHAVGTLFPLEAAA